VERGFHAHRELRQWMVCLNGSFSITVDDGEAREVVELTSPDRALEIGAPVWREMRASSPDAVLMVLASELYDESDYVHDYDDFLQLARHG
jgi:dTDP-4-dehydrorhamnose 3,5-epimerase-like enzyme